MAFTYQELRNKTLAELREIAKDITHEAVAGYSQMNKDHLLPAICTALGIREHHEVHGIDKAAIKARMRALKGEKAQALASGDRGRVRALRRQLHRLNHRIRAHMS